MKRDQLTEEDSQSQLITNQGGNDINATKQGRDYSSIIDEKAIVRKKRIKWGIIGGLILIAIILAIVLPITLHKKSSHDDPVNPPTPPAPTGYNNYKISNQNDDESTLQGELTSQYEYSHDAHMQALNRIMPTLKDGSKLAVDSQKIPKGVNNNLATKVNFKFDMLTWRVARLNLYDNTKKRYSIPEEAVAMPKGDDSMRLDMLGLELAGDSFGFRFKDPINPKKHFLSTVNQTLVLMDKFIQMDFELPSQRLYGLGERIHDFQLDEGTWTMWAVGLDSPIDDGKGRKGLYGVHPFVLVQTDQPGDYIGIYFRNSNAQSPVLSFTDGGKSILSYITTGGQIEAYFFIHGTAKDIISQYQKIFGKPQLPPFWSLGWQQASWKYTNQSMVEEVIAAYDKNDLPLETMYLDIPYMDNYVDFTVNYTAFNKISSLADSLHNAGRRLVVIIDAAMSAEDVTANNKYYTKGNSDDIFIKSSLYKSTKYNGNLIASVWPKTAVFIDWFNKQCINTWSYGLNELYKTVAYDGIWIDMNEPTTFRHGETKPEDITPAQEHQIFLKESATGDSDNSWYYSFPTQDKDSTFEIPFVPGYKQHDDGLPGPYDGNFDYMTISLNATLPSIGETQYNVHSLYGLMMSKTTQQYLTGYNSPKPDERTFILSRSTFTGSGQYASHWLGDNWRDWNYMKLSIDGIMNMNMFGISHAGADVCGFFGEKIDQEMCARWIQLSTFYPLARAHQNLTYKGNDSDRSEPYYLTGDYFKMAQSSMKDRYRYLRHMYTCMFEASINGGSCIEPLFFYYPDDQNLYGDASSTFMVGGAIKVSPVLKSLDAKTTMFDSYFPKGNWVSLSDYADIVKSAGETKQLSATQKTVQAHLRPGSLIAYQDTTKNVESEIKLTKDLINQPIQLIINRDDNNVAQGTLFLDKGISRTEIADDSKGYEYYKINHQSKSIQFQFVDGKRGNQNAQLDQIVITNADDLKTVSFACYMDNKGQMNDLVAKPDDVKSTLTISSATPVMFNQILNVYYGSDANKDLNLCKKETFQYKIVDGKLPDLNNTNVTVELQHVAGILPNIQVHMRVIQIDIVNVKWSWKLDDKGNVPDGKRVPAEVPNEFINSDFPDSTTKLNQFITVQDAPFQVVFKYRSYTNPSNVFKIEGMVFDSYLNWINVQAQLEAGVDKFQGIFGLGERASKDFFYKDGVYSMWARDQPTPDEEGTSPGANMYGTHPYFMYKHKSNAWVGVLYKLAHAQDWWITNNKVDGTVGISTIATGGVADIYVFQAQFPDDVVNKYFRLIGRPTMVPQWALGWNQCRWGYKTLDMLKDVVQKYDANNIPLDVAWSDIDHMNKYRSFEYDPVRFAELPQFVDQLHKSGRRYVPILDAGIAYRPENNDYTAFTEAYDQKLFTTVKGEPFIGQVWPNDASYPDYTNPDTVTWFQMHLGKLHDEIAFDGLWQDMNEASNFCNGACYRYQTADKPIKYNLPYTPTGRDLETKSMPLDTQHKNGLLQLDTHSYYGTENVMASHGWFEKNNMRTFIIERSSFAGMGKFSSRWLGDNFSDERFMGYSVSGIMLMNIFGITFAGSDICGFIGDTNPNLCARWHYLGAYYPFSRNHNNWGQISQEPWAWGDAKYEEKPYIDLFREAIKIKYSLIRYYYTNLFMVSHQSQSTFFRPMFFEFPDDMNAYTNITQNVMIGKALKLSINSEYVDQNQTQFYMPAGIWCNMTINTDCIVSTGQFYTLSTKVYETYLALRQGYIVPFQNISQSSFKTSKDLQDLPIELHILGEPGTNYVDWYAQGVYINDDGLVLDITGNFNGYNFVARASTTSDLSIKILPTIKATNYKDKMEKGCYGVNQNDYLGALYFYNGADFQNNFNYKVTATFYDGSPAQDLGQATYNAQSDRLEITFKSSMCMSNLQQITLLKAA